MVTRVHPVLISARGLLNRSTFGPVVSRVACNALTLGLGFSNSKLLRDEAIFDDLIDVLFLRKRPLVIEIQIPHLLADVRLMNALGVAHVTVTSQTLTNKATVEAVCMGSCGSLLVSAWLDLIFAQ